MDFQVKNGMDLVESSYILGSIDMLNYLCRNRLNIKHGKTPKEKSKFNYKFAKMFMETHATTGITDEAPQIVMTTLDPKACQSWHHTITDLAMKSVPSIMAELMLTPEHELDMYRKSLVRRNKGETMEKLMQKIKKIELSWMEE